MGNQVLSSTAPRLKRVNGVADFLKAHDFATAHFHAGCTADDKHQIQDVFRMSELHVIAETNALVMPIDKPDMHIHGLGGTVRHVSRARARWRGTPPEDPVGPNRK